MIPENGNIVLRQTSYSPQALFSKTNTLIYNIDFDIFCHMKYNFENDNNQYETNNVFDAWAKCGNFTVENVVKESSQINYYTPFCKLSSDGHMLACLIYGEPYIFDIGDRQSAYPISSFEISSSFFGTAIVKFFK